MGKKLEGNGLWESSRIILPEHKEGYLRLMKDRQRRGKPELDDQEVQLIEQAFNRVLQYTYDRDSDSI